MIIIASFLLLLCSCVGIALRYAPFAPIISPHQKRDLRICYTIAIMLKLVSLVILMAAGGVEGAFLYLRYGLLFHAAILTLVNIFLIPGHLREHLFVFGVVMTFKYLLMAIPNYLITLYPDGTPTAYLFLILVTYTATLLISYFPLRRLLKKTITPFLHLQEGSYWNTVWFIPIALFGIRFLQVGGEHNTGSIVQLLSHGLSASIVILMCMSITKSHQRESGKRHLEAQLLQQQGHYLALQAHVEDARKTRHDLKHHMAAILNLVEHNDREGCRNYCMDLMDSVQVREHIPYTGNSAADGVLYHYLQRCRDYEVQLELRGIINSPGIADVDLCVLLGNALDNALAACQTVPENRFIQVISQSENQLLSIMVRNNHDGQIRQTDRGILSRKRDNAPGIGLQSMEAVCRRCGGEMTIHYDHETFTVIFLLPLSDQ
ncbi:MAG: GHKL domain-containing protein [Ruminococcaceae bacterium]|nr:GHKL domain-containing protein [Oscillospiraceae bacterium]